MLLTGFSLGCLAVIFVIVLRDFWHLPVAKVFLALLISASAYLLRDTVNPEMRWLTGDIMTLLPALFWLLCQLAFSRKPKLISIWSALAIYSFVAPAVTRPFGAHEASDSLLHILGVQIPQFSEYALIIHGLWILLANWKDDLIASRRQLRGALIIILGVVGLWVTISMNTGHGSSVALPFVTSIASLMTAYLLLKGRQGVLLGSQKKLSPLTPVIEVSAEAIAQQKQKDELKKHVAILERVMDEEKFYRTEKLTLGMLSQEIGLPDYKTRALINQTFKYRNFNDYVNQLRIEEASDRLITEQEEPIQNIALDVGYRTLSSFNRAFKEILDQTPTEFRQSKS